MRNNTLADFCIVPLWPWNANTTGGCSVALLGAATRACRLMPSTVQSIGCGSAAGSNISESASAVMAAPLRLACVFLEEPCDQLWGLGRVSVRPTVDER